MNKIYMNKSYDILYNKSWVLEAVVAPSNYLFYVEGDYTFYASSGYN